MPNPFSSAWDWYRNVLARNPLNSAYYDPTKPMAGEPQYEYDTRRALLGTGAAVAQGSVGPYNPFTSSISPLGIGQTISREAIDLGKYLFAPAPPPAPAKPQGGKVVPAVSKPKPFEGSSGSGLPADARGVRNNNLLNLTVSPFTQSQPGYVGTDTGGRYAKFASAEAGQAAAEKLLGSYIKRGFDTPAEIIGRWAPASENGNASTSNYAGYVAAGLGIGPNDKVTPQQIPFLAKRMAEFENGATQGGPQLQAFRSAVNATGLNTPPPAPDLSGYQRADQLYGQIAQNAIQPISGEYNALPPLPKPEPLQGPDTSAGDAAFAAAAPKNPFGATPEDQAKGQLKMRRADYFAGLGQALGSIDWSRGVGLGELFAKMGAGALMGAKAGDAEVQQRQDKFDSAMQQYQLALANRDDNKAREASNIMNQNIQQNNQYARDQFAMQAKEVQGYITDDGTLVTKERSPDGKRIIETHTPLSKAKQASALMAQAQNAVAEGAAKNEFTYRNFEFSKSLAASAVPYAMADAQQSGNFQGRDGLFAIGMFDAANSQVDTGQARTTYERYLPGGANMAAARQAEAYKAAGIPVDPKTGAVPYGVTVSEKQQEQIKDYLSTKMVEDFISLGKSWALTGGQTKNRDTGEVKYNPPATSVLISVGQQRERDRKTTETVNAKGQRSVTERY